VSLLRRDAGEVEALVTDRYLDSLLAISPDGGERGRLVDASGAPDRRASVGAAVRAVSRRLATDLPRFHPSFRFEERLALRLAELAASIRLPVAAGGEGQVVSIRSIRPANADPLVSGDPGEDEDRDARPLLIGGAVAASALSLAGAWLAWRRRTSPMARAIRAAHHIRPGA
jgi:hypothetical protein